MKLYATRHGQTEWNAKNIILGRTDIPLSGEGIRQAQRLAGEAAALSLGRIISSPMKRAMQTAEIVAEKAGLPVQVDERLIEWDYGTFEGKSCTMEDFPKAKAAWGCKMPGGESVFQVVQRTYNVIDDVKRLYVGEDVLLVCHGGICRVIDSYFYDMTLEKFMGFFMGNCEIRQYDL